MRITLVNLTDWSLSVNSAGLKSPELYITTFPSLSTSFKAPSRLSRLTITANLKENIGSSVCTFHIKKRSFNSWEVTEIDEGCPWRIYQVRTSRKHVKILIFPRRNLKSFLSEMSDSTPLSSLVLPGTHNTLAFYGWPVAQCQSVEKPLPEQLNSGIRVLDIRLAVQDSLLMVYHGTYPQRTSFQYILAMVHSFLAEPSSYRETIVMSIKQEDFSTTPITTFSQLVHKEIFNGPGGKEMWFLENRIPLLGEVRGKVVMFSRFGGDGTGWEYGLEGLGIHPTIWPNSVRNGFQWNCKGTVVRTHDWYSITFLDIPEKVVFSTENLILPLEEEPTRPVLPISYFSAASFPLALPTVIARGVGWPAVGFGVEGVNSRVGSWLLDILGSTDAVQKGRKPKLRGWTFMDFYESPEDHGVVPLLVECNFR